MQYALKIVGRTLPSVIRPGLLLLVLSMPILLKAAPAVTPGGQVRLSVVAGTWYPGDAGRLDSLLEGFLQQAPSPHGEGAAPVRAIISPHAAYRYSGATAAAGFRAAQGRHVKRVIVLGPSHHGDFYGLSVPTLAAYRTPLGQVEVDLDAVAELHRHALVGDYPLAHAKEHSVEMQLPFLQKVLAPGWKLVPVLVGRIDAGDYRRAASLLRPLADKDTLIVVSTDFTHYGAAFDYLPFRPSGQVAQRLHDLDMGAYDQIAALSLQGFLDYRHNTGITICGYRAVAILLAMLPETASVSLQGYAIGGNPAARSAHSVSYLSALIRSPQPLAGTQAGYAAEGRRISQSGMALLHELASRAIEQAVSPGSSNERVLASLVGNLPEELQQPLGVFVTLWKAGDLRGCKGHVENGHSLYSLVIRDGISAALYDFRTPSLQARELPGLDIEISVLSPLRRISSLQQWVIGQQGLYLFSNGHHALYLPDVARLEGWDAGQTLSHLCEKAGLTLSGCESDELTLYAFTTQTYRAPYVARSLSENG